MKRTLIYFILAAVIGVGLAIYMFKGVKEVVADTSSDNFVNAFQLGVFSNYENAYNFVNNYSDAVIFFENEKYHVYSNVVISNKIKQYYITYYQDNNTDFIIKEIKVDSDCFETIKKYEQLALNKKNEDIYSYLNSYVMDYYVGECHD